MADRLNRRHQHETTASGETRDPLELKRSVLASTSVVKVKRGGFRWTIRGFSNLTLGTSSYVISSPFVVADLTWKLSLCAGQGNPVAVSVYLELQSTGLQPDFSRKVCFTMGFFNDAGEPNTPKESGRERKAVFDTDRTAFGHRSFISRDELLADHFLGDTDTLIVCVNMAVHVGVESSPTAFVPTSSSVSLLNVRSALSLLPMPPNRNRRGKNSQQQLKQRGQTDTAAAGAAALVPPAEEEETGTGVESVPGGIVTLLTSGAHHDVLIFAPMGMSSNDNHPSATPLREGKGGRVLLQHRGHGEGGEEEGEHQQEAGASSAAVPAAAAVATASHSRKRRKLNARGEEAAVVITEDADGTTTARRSRSTRVRTSPFHLQVEGGRAGEETPSPRGGDNGGGGAGAGAGVRGGEGEGGEDIEEDNKAELGTKETNRTIRFRYGNEIFGKGSTVVSKRCSQHGGPATAAAASSSSLKTPASVKKLSAARSLEDDDDNDEEEQTGEYSSSLDEGLPPRGMIAFRAHKSILALRSPYFRAMFGGFSKKKASVAAAATPASSRASTPSSVKLRSRYGAWSEEVQTGHVIIEDISARTLWLLLVYLYSHNLPPAQSSLSLARAAAAAS